MRCSNVVRTLRLLAAAALVVTAACGDSPESPSPAPLVLTMPAAVEGRYSTCQTCADPVAVVVTFAVTVTDASGPGGTIATLETRVMDTSRGVEVARNTRPNGSVGLSPSALPARGQVTIEAGIGFPPPPPRDSLTVIATATLTDGRQASASAPLTIVG
jgi:hypothetical protein